MKIFAAAFLAVILLAAGVLQAKPALAAEQFAPAASAAPAAPVAPTQKTPTDRAAAKPAAVDRLQPAETAQVVRMSLVLALVAFLPAIAICMTPFIRIVVVLSMVRYASGMPETPPNPVLISLALFITAFVMAPTLSSVNTAALQPFLAGSMPVGEAMEKGAKPMREFMLRQVHDKDIRTIYTISRRPLPNRASDVGVMELAPAFMLNELRVSFTMGFLIFVPFLLIDIVVSSVLLSLGMLMVPPSTISLPIKILMFVLIDGWSLVLQGVVGSIR